MRTFIIAEAGVNHNGDLNIAKQMIDVAVDLGVDAIKFQTFKAENIATKFAPKAKYQINTTGNNEHQVDMLKKFELTDFMHQELIQYCRGKIEFLSTPFSVSDVDYLISLGLEKIKIPSGEITNLPYLRHVGKLDKEIILSTGMATMQEIKNAIDILVNAGTSKERIAVLHCTSEYPACMDDVNLSAMRSMAEELELPIGYSDHTRGIEVAIAAVALGATIIEKHFTLDKSMPGPDHQASVETDELGQMVKLIRNIEIALGSHKKQPTRRELENRKIARKSIVAGKNIKKGEVLTEYNLTTKRPGMGLSPMEWDSVLGTFASRNFEKDEVIDNKF